MSPDDTFLASVARALRKAKLEAILIGNAAAAVQNVAVMTKDVDFFVRDTALVRKKIDRVVILLNAAGVSKPYAPISEMLRIHGVEVPVDFVFQVSSRKSFESIRSRAHKIKLGSESILAADLADVIAAKKAANRKKDRASLPLLEESLRAKKKLA